MSTTAELLQAQKRKLQKTINDKASIKQAIINKRGGIDIGNNPSTYAQEIENIEPLLDTIDITENGLYNVKDYKNAKVFVHNTDYDVLKTILENRRVSELKIPYGIEAILTKLPSNTSKVEVPVTVTKFGKSTFNNGSKAYYDGSFSQWISIEKSEKPRTQTYDFYPWADGGSVDKIVKLYINNEHVRGNITIPTDVTNLKIGALSCFCSEDSTYTSKQNKHVLTIPENVNSLSQGCLAFLSGFHTIKFEGDSQITEIPDSCFYNSCPYSNDDATSEIILPKNVIVIYGFAFKSTEYNKIVLGDKVERLEGATFEYSKVETIILPSSLKSISSSAFNGCIKLKEITIPENVESIGSSAFAGMNVSQGLQTITMKGTTPPTIATNTFSAHTKFKIYVPKGTRNTYTNATNWSRFANYIYEKYIVVFNVPSTLLNNETITYSIDGGKTYQMFTNGTLSLNEVATIKIKSTDSSQVVKIGTSAGASDVGTISNSELTFSFTTDTSVYLTIQ